MTGIQHLVNKMQGQYFSGPALPMTCFIYVFSHAFAMNSLPYKESGAVLGLIYSTVLMTQEL